MNILIWNIRDILSSKARLRHIMNKHQPSVLEPFISVNKLQRWSRWLHLPNFCYNVDVGGKIWLFWAEDIDFQMVSKVDQSVLGWFSCDNSRVFSTFVYASCFQRQRQVLWSYLCDVDVGGGSWFLGGDFNITRSESEKIGGLFGSSQAHMDFNNCIQNCGLLDLPSMGQCLSWCNGRLGGGGIWARLDRALVNANFVLCFLDAKMEYLSRTSSDHCLMVTQLFGIHN